MPTIEELLAIEPQPVAPTPRQFMDLPLPEPPRQTRYFGGQTMRSRFDPFEVQQAYRRMAMEQQAEDEARRLTEQLNSIDPNSPNVVQQRFSAISANPMGVATQMGSAVLRAFDATVPQPRTAVRDDTQDIIDDLYQAGATDDEVASMMQGGVLNRGAAMRRIGLGRPDTPRSTNRLSEIERQLKLLNDPLLSASIDGTTRSQLLRRLADELVAELGGSQPAAAAGAPAAPQMTREEAMEALAERLKGL